MTALHAPDDEILVHANWLAALARELVADRSDAEDLVQDTFLTALRSHPPRQGTLRGWLAGILRNTAYQRNRSESRRRRREVRAAVHAGAACTDDHDSAATRRRLLAAVQKLREPYRSTILQRYLEGLPPREIARRQGVPVRTVTTRLTRGLKMLRVRLDAEFPERSWRAALLPLALPPRRLRTAARRLAWASAAAAAGTVLTLGWSAGRGAGAEQQARRLDAALLPAGPGAGAAPREAAPAAPRGRHALASSAAESAADDLECIPIRGRVSDLEGRPIGGLEIQFEPGRMVSRPGLEPSFRRAAESCPARTTSGADGSFALDVPAGHTGRLRADGSGYVAAVTELRLGRDPQLLDCRLVVAPLRPLRGRVVSAEGAPRAGAEVHFAPGSLPLEASRNPMALTARTRTGAGGGFEFERTYRTDEAWLLVEHPDHEPVRVALAPEETEVRVVLPQRVPGARLRGVVVDHTGAPLGDAMVAAQGRLAHAGDGGEFELELLPDRPFERLVAVASDHLPATWTPPDPRADPAAPGFLTLRLQRAPLAIRGVVLDTRGRPAAGWHVWVVDPTPFAIDHHPWFVENLMGNPRSRFSVLAVTDEAGRFELAPLTERDYHVRAVHRDSLRSVERRGVPAGERELVLRLPADRAAAALEGRVVSASGEALDGVRVATSVLCVQTPVPWLPGPFELSVDGAATETDGGGRFALPPQGTEHVFLRVTAPRVFPTAVGLSELDLSAPLELTVPLRSQVRFAASPEVDATHLRLFDSSGEPCSLLEHQDRLFHVMLVPYEELPVEKAAGATWDVPDTAATAVLYRDGVEVGRLPLALSPERLNRVDLSRALP